MTARMAGAPVGWAGGSHHVHGKDSGQRSHRFEMPRVDRRWAAARDVRPGDTLRGGKGGIYSVLDATPVDGRIELLVIAPSGRVRTWTRRPDFALERA